MGNFWRIYPSNAVDPTTRFAVPAGPPQEAPARRGAAKTVGFDFAMNDDAEKNRL